ncbi:MAG: porphobilinogen synthase, partial [Alphaproteobacteria bacterium]|nr:porphobilinogen synthase [Alphaproteobacteria bacterium]
MSPASSFPSLRMRRLRRHDWTRRLVSENKVTAADFIWPLFLIDGKKRREPILTMPGVERLSVDLAVAAA